MKNTALALAAFAISALITAQSAFGWSNDGQVPWRQLDASVVTPHRTFANPASGKLPKVLVFAYGLGQREILELKQRVDYEFIVLPTYTNYTLHPFAKGHRDPAGGSLYSPAMTKDEYFKEVEDIMAQLPTCDAIMLCKLPFSLLSKDIADKVMARVAEGAGFIIIDTDNKKSDLPGVKLENASVDFPMDAVPSLKGTLLRKGSHGKGQVLSITYFNNFPESPVENITPRDCDHPLFYDYNLAFVGKCLWTLTCPQRLCISSVTPDGKVTISNLPQNASTISFEVADEFGGIVASGTTQAAQECALELGTLPASAKMLDVKLLDADGKTIDFQCAPVATQAKIISKFVLDKEAWFPDETMTGSIELSSQFNGKLQLTITDDSGRILANSIDNFRGNSRKFSFDLLHQLSRYASVSAKLFDKAGILVDETRQDIYFNTSAQQGDFFFGIWSYASFNSRVDALWLKMMHDNGVDFLMEGGAAPNNEFAQKASPRSCKRSGLDFASYITRLVGSQKTEAGICPYGYWEQYQNTGNVLNDSNVPLDGDSNFLNIVKNTKDIGAVFYNLGDENSLSMTGSDTGNCFCAACQRRFKDYLRRHYASIEALNEEYSTDYKDFSEVDAMPFFEAKAANQPARWVDFRLFMEEQFINWHLYKRDLIRSLDATSRVGLEGMISPGSSFNGFNFPKMLPNFEFCAPYLNTREGHALKYLPKTKSLKSAWFGTYTNTMREQQMRQVPWHYLFSGLNGAFYWYSGIPINTNSFTTSCICSPDLKPLTQFTSAAEEIAVIKNSGIGQLLINSKMSNDGIWVHYSNNSMHADTFTPYGTTWANSHANFENLLDSIGVGFEYASTEELEKGVPDDIRMLILPFSQAMTPAEVKSVRNFVARGGFLVADIMPAMADGHGKPLATSQLQDIFGKFEKLHIKSYGTGYAIYLGDYLNGADMRIKENRAPGLQKGFQHLLAKAGIKPFATITLPDGSHSAGTVFENGTDKYICILAPRSAEQGNNEASSEVGIASQKSSNEFRRNIVLTKPMYIYDMLDGNKCLGYFQEFSIELKPAVGRVLACVEEPMEAPTIKRSSRSVKPGDAISFKFKGIHNAAVFQVLNPSGETVYSRRVSEDETARFVPAFNDATGVYTARIANAIGGKASDCTFTLK